MGNSRSHRIAATALSLLAVFAMSCRPAGDGRTATPSDALSPREGLQTVDGEPLDIAEMEASIEAAMTKARVAGLSCAVLNEGRLAYVHQFGVADAETGRRPGPDTVFAGASFSKTVFAFLVMTLVQDGVIDLDRPIHEYWDRPLPQYEEYADLEGDDRWRQVTARQVLDHSTGFPNWRFGTEDGRLRFLFDPGERFSYSGEGIQLLQKTVEKVTGSGLEELAAERVFQPFGMTRTSYVWQEEWEGDHAVPHDEFGRPKRLNRRRTADAAGSLFTTATDFGRFLEGLLAAASGSGDRSRIINTMFTPQLPIVSQRMFGPGAFEDTKRNDDLSWCLGWGCFRTADGRAFFHTGHDFGWQNYTVTHLDRGVGVVLLSNSDSFESVAQELVEAVIGEDGSPFEWLGYQPFDPSQLGEPPPERVALSVDPAVLVEYEGVYELKPGDLVVVRLEEDRLQISKNRQDWDDLLAESPTLFFIRGEDQTFEFSKDPAGTVNGLIVHVQGARIRLRRVG